MNLINTNSSEIAKIVYDYIERGIGTEYDLFNSPPPPIYIGPVKVKTLKERLEEATMHADCEFCIKRDICTRNVPKPCRYRYTEEERIADQASDIYGYILAGMYLPKTYQKKKEENEMEPTSVWEIENIDEISITQDGDEISLLLKNRDDITKITLTGDAIKNHNDNFITTLKVDMEDDANTRFEQEQKIKKLQEKNKNLKKHVKFQIDNYNDILTNNHKLREENRHLKKELALEKAANYAHHKFFRQYAGKGTEIEFNYAIDNTTDEVMYVIVDKEKYEALKNCDCKVRLHGMDFTPDELVDRIRELEEGNKDLRAEFDKVTKRAEELRKMINESKGLHYPITRERVLEQAKECVCGQREQDYGTPESNFQLIADLWNGYLGFMDHPQDQIRATDVAMMMALMKIARIRNGGGSVDSFVDLAGYAACGGEIYYGERHSST